MPRAVYEDGCCVLANPFEVQNRRSAEYKATNSDIYRLVDQAWIYFEYSRARDSAVFETSNAKNCRVRSRGERFDCCFQSTGIIRESGLLRTREKACVCPKSCIPSEKTATVFELNEQVVHGKILVCLGTDGFVSTL